MKTTMIIMSKVIKEKIITVIDPQQIPRIGEQIDMGYEPVPIVVKVLYKYHPDETEIFIVTD